MASTRAWPEFCEQHHKFQQRLRIVWHFLSHSDVDLHFHFGIKENGKRNKKNLSQEKNKKGERWTESIEWTKLLNESTKVKTSHVYRLLLLLLLLLLRRSEPNLSQTLLIIPYYATILKYWQLSPSIWLGRVVATSQASVTHDGVMEFD